MVIYSIPSSQTLEGWNCGKTPLVGKQQAPAYCSAASRHSDGALNSIVKQIKSSRNAH